MPYRIIITLLFSIVVTGNNFSQDFGIMTYNIRLDTPSDGVDQWAFRKAALADLVKKYHPVILGIQEGLPDQVTYLDSVLTSYTYTGVGRDGDHKGEYSALFYDTTRFRMIRGATFWLSETPEKVSRGWDAALNRICTWGYFVSKEHACSLYVFNTHFDHRGTEARRNSASLILSKIDEITDHESFPVVLLGDFNATPDQTPIHILSTGLKDAASVCPSGIIGPEGTFTGFQTTDPPDRRIDYIFVRKLTVISYLHVSDLRPNGRRISDHLPIRAVVTCSSAADPDH